jgi:hypothetical protein
LPSLRRDGRKGHDSVNHDAVILSVLKPFAEILLALLPAA